MRRILVTIQQHIISFSAFTSRPHSRSCVFLHGIYVISQQIQIISIDQQLMYPFQQSNMVLWGSLSKESAQA